LIIIQLGRIDIDVVLLGEASKAGDVLYARHGFQLFLENPILDFLLANQVLIGL